MVHRRNPTVEKRTVSALRPFAVLGLIFLGAAVCQAKDVLITSTPDDALVSITGIASKCVPLDPKGPKSRTPCKISLEDNYFNEDGGEKDFYKRLEKPVKVKLSLDGHKETWIDLTPNQPKTRQYQDGHFNIGPPKTYYFITADKFAATLPEIDYYQEAKQLLDDKQYQKANESFQIALSKDPGNADACFYSYQAYIGVGNKSKATEMLQKAVDIKPDLTRQLLLASVYSESGKPKDAAKLYDLILQNPDNPKPFDTALKLAMIDESLGDWQSARAAYEKALQIDNTSDDVRLILVHIDTEHGDEKAALSECEQVLARLRNAECINIVGAAYLKMAKEKLEAKRYQDALKDLDHAKIRSDLAAEATYLLVQAYQGLAQYNDVLRVARQLADLLQKPKTPDEHMWLGHSQALLGNYDTAIREFREAAKTNLQAERFLWLTTSLSMLSDRDEALQDEELKVADQFVHSQPTLAKAHLARCRAALDKRGSEAQNAWQECQKAVDLDTNDAEAQYYLSRALFYSEQKEDAAAAAKAAKLAIAKFEKYPYKDAVQYYVLARAHKDLKENDKAIAAYQQALRLQPDFVKAIYDLCNLYLDDNQKKNDAKMCINRLQPLSPKQAKDLLQDLQ
jgi:tetratricopeptide (TPR) repeat protein